MINLLSISAKDLNQTTALMQSEVKKRGWHAEVPYIGSPLCFLKRADGKEIRIFSATPPTTSFAAGYLANDKFATYRLLESLNIRQLESVICDTNTNDELIAKFIDAHQCIVVKPIDGGHGKGISVNVTTTNAAKTAISKAAVNNKSSNKVILQQQYMHTDIYDLRILCIEYKFIGAIHRLPANVAGDGVQTVRELIESENSKDYRGEPYKAPLASIDIIEAEKFLGDTFQAIPKSGEVVYVLGVANYGAGGETIDVTEDIPRWLIQEAERIAKGMQLPVAGVDYLTARPPKADSTKEDLDAIAIEVNKCPALSIHDLPTRGISRNAVSRYFEYLASI